MGTQCICYLYANVHSACQGLANYYCTAISQVYGREGRGGLTITQASGREGVRRRGGEGGVREEGEETRARGGQRDARDVSIVSPDKLI